MADTKKIAGISTLLLIVLVTGFFISMQGRVGLEVTCDGGAVFYLNNSGTWESAGRQTYLLLHNEKPVAVPERCSVTKQEDDRTGMVEINRTSYFSEDRTITELYRFNQSNEDITLFPLEQEVIVLNAPGHFLLYKLDGAPYEGDHSFSVFGPQKFGEHMKVEWDAGERFLIAQTLANQNKTANFSIYFSVNKKWESYRIRYYDPPSTEYEVNFCGDDGGFTGGSMVSGLCLYNATASSSTFRSPHEKTCLQCNETFWFNLGNLTGDGAKAYYATTNGSNANERYIFTAMNATHFKVQNEPGYTFEIGPIPVETWNRMVIATNYTNASPYSTVYVYDASGAEYATFIGTKTNQSISSARFFAFYTGTFNPNAWFTNYTVTNILGDPGTASGSGINLTLNNPANNSLTNVTSIMLNVTVWNLNTTTNSSLNVSFFTANNSLLKQVNWTANGSTVTYNWSVVALQEYQWYITVRTTNNTLNITDLRFTRTDPNPGNISVLLVSHPINTSVVKNQYFNFTINITCTGNSSCGSILAYLDPVNIQNASFPYKNSSTFNGRTVQGWIDLWAGALWNDTVVCDFNTARGMCAVAWYSTSQSNADSNMHNCIGTPPGGAGCTKNKASKQFPFVTDEGGNALLIHAVASNQTRFELLWNFTELTNHNTPNGLQCWTGHVNGVDSYTSYTDVCSTSDSASDASIRILGALDIACAKQRAGIWKNGTAGFGTDYCTAFVTQGKKIWGFGTSSHGEVKKLSSGRYFLANGYNNQVNAPTTFQSFRPDYYELWALQDWAEYMNNDTLVDGVGDMLEAANASFNSGASAIVPTKTGHFNSDGLTGYACDEGPVSCANGTGKYMDSIDTWRAVPSIAMLLANHPEDIPSGLNVSVFYQWWIRYAGGNGSYGPTASKPIEIYSDPSVSNKIKSTSSGSRASGMWLPLGIRFNQSYVNDSASHVTGSSLWDASNSQFFGEGYMDAYFSSFPVRALAAGAGLMSHNYYALIGNTTSFAPATYNKNNTLVSTTVGDIPFYTINANPQGSIDPPCLTNMTNGSSCAVSWIVNATGEFDTVWLFYAYATSTLSGVSARNSSFITLTIAGNDTTVPSMSSPSVRLTNSTANISWTTTEAANSSIRYGNTTLMPFVIGNSSLGTVHNFSITGLTPNTTYYYSRISCDLSANCATEGVRNFTTSDITPPNIFALIVTPTSSSVGIAWNTSESANQSVNYGTTIDLGTTSGTNFFLSQRQISFFGLTSNTLYHFNLTSCDTSGNCATNGTFNFTTLNLSGSFTSLVNGSSANAFSAELGTLVNFNASTVNSSTICYDIDHVDYGTNYLCSTSMTLLNLSIMSFVRTTLNDSTAIKNLTFTGSNNNTVYIIAHKKDEFINLTLNVTGFASSGTFPTAVRIYINNTLTNTIGLILNVTKGFVSTFNDSTTSKRITFTTPGVQTIGYLRLPSGADITNASMRFQGFSNYTLQETADVIGATENSGIVYLNYTKPTSSSNSTLWQVKYQHSSTGVLTENLTLTDTCWTASSTLLQLRVAETESTLVVLQCFNTSGEWHTLRSVGSSGACVESSFCQNPGQFSTVTTTYDASYTTGANFNSHFTRWCAQGCSSAVTFYEEAVFWNIAPIDSWMEAGTVTGNRSWNYSAALQGNDTSNDFASRLDTFLSGCTADSEGYCNAPIFLYSFGGAINVSNMSVNYTYDPNPVVIDENKTRNYLNNGTGNTTVIPLTFTSSQAGILQVSALRYRYAGGNNSIAVVAHNDDYSQNNTKNLTLYASNWNYTLPQRVVALEFIPSSPTSRSVQPFGQTAVRPILNITSNSYGGKPFNFSIYSNETYSCVNLSVGNTSNRSLALQLGVNWTTVLPNVSYLQSQGIWMWADYNYNRTTWYLWEPNLSFRACAHNVTCSNAVS